MIEHYVNDHTGDGNVQPERQGPTRNCLMTRKVSAPGTADGNDHKRDNYNCEKRVRREDREIDRSRNSLSEETRHPMMLVIDDVRNQKQH